MLETLLEVTGLYRKIKIYLSYKFYGIYDIVFKEKYNLHNLKGWTQSAELATKGLKV